MDGPRITVGVHVVASHEPPFIARDYTDLCLHRALLAVDIAMLRAVRRMMWRIVACGFIEGARKATLAGLSGLNLGLAAWAFCALIVPQSVPTSPPLALIIAGLLAAWAWFEFTVWWNRRGLDALLGL